MTSPSELFGHDNYIQLCPKMESAWEINQMRNLPTKKHPMYHKENGSKGPTIWNLNTHPLHGSSWSISWAFPGLSITWLGNRHQVTWASLSRDDLLAPKLPALLKFQIFEEVASVVTYGAGRCGGTPFLFGPSWKERCHTMVPSHLILRSFTTWIIIVVNHL